MPVVVESGETMGVYPTEIVPTEPKYKLGQIVPNCFNMPYFIAGIRCDVEYQEEWVPCVSPTPDVERDIDGDNTPVIVKNEWEYKLVRKNSQGKIREWGWCKESEIEKDILSAS
jgi:hypothetical protein